MFCLSICLYICLSICLSIHPSVRLSVCLQIHHKKEPRNRYTETDDRPDIVVFDTDNGKNIDLDISLAHPWSKDVIKLAAREQGFAAKRREDRKKTKYEQELLPGGSAPNMIPLVYEHFGHWGSEAESFLCHLAKKSRNAEGQQNTVEFLNYWRRRFSVSLQRCNAKVVLKKISRLSCGVNEECRLFDRDIHISVH